MDLAKEMELYHPPNFTIHHHVGHIEYLRNHTTKQTIKPALSSMSEFIH